VTPQPSPHLRPGDLVAVCATSSPSDSEKLTSGLSILSKRYRISTDTLLDHRKQEYLAGTDEQRAEALMRALADPDVRAIFMTRGGYGALRIVDALDATILRRDPKPLCGFSDGTVLLNWWLQQGVVSIHGPVTTQLSRLSPQALQHLWRLLEDPDYRPSYRPVADETAGPPHPNTDEDEGVDHCCAGRLWGGNLATLTTMLGSPLARPLSGGAILVLEDVAEPAYRLDRMITQMHRGGCLEETRWAALGSFSAPAGAAPTESNLSTPNLAGVIANRLDDFGIPTTSGFPWGHGSRNRAIPLGVTAEWNDQALLVTSGAVQ